MRAEGRQTARRILCVFPRYTSSFGTFEYAYPLTDGVQAFMPPQGLLLIAAYMPENWEVRFVDENIRVATDDDFRWAEAVFVSGMHIQRTQMNDICHRATPMIWRWRSAARRCRHARNTIRRSTICIAASSATPPIG